MRFLPDGDSMKAADKDTIENLGIPSLELMERAARSCIDSMKKEKLDFTDVLIVCGSGNNGGDGFAIARLLKEEGCAVTVFMAGNPGISGSFLKALEDRSATTTRMAHTA